LVESHSISPFEGDIGAGVLSNGMEAPGGVVILLGGLWVDWFPAASLGSAYTLRDAQISAVNSEIDANVALLGWTEGQESGQEEKDSGSHR
jgi:hypothetical protein